MLKSNYIAVIAGLLCLLTTAACTPNATDFAQISGYDSQGTRTGSIFPSPGTLTPY